MFRLSPRRNQRSKGLKVKHALQIFVLLGVCIWLVYQVQHSGNQKRSYEESTNISEKLNDLLKLGRKDLKPQGEEANIIDQRHKEEENEEESKPENDGEGEQTQGEEKLEGENEGNFMERGKETEENKGYEQKQEEGEENMENKNIEEGKNGGERESDESKSEEGEQKEELREENIEIKNSVVKLPPWRRHGGLRWRNFRIPPWGNPPLAVLSWRRYCVRHAHGSVAAWRRHG